MWILIWVHQPPHLEFLFIVCIGRCMNSAVGCIQLPCVAPRKMGNHMGVSWNLDTPKASTLIGFSIINKPSILGYPHFRKAPICS